MPNVRIAHDLSRAEVRRRMAARADDLVKLIPGGLGSVEHRWENDDRMDFVIHAMGHSIASSLSLIHI